MLRRIIRWAFAEEIGKLERDVRDLYAITKEHGKYGDRLRVVESPSTYWASLVQKLDAAVERVDNLERGRADGLDRFAKIETLLNDPASAGTGTTLANLQGRLMELEVWAERVRGVQVAPASMGMERAIEQAKSPYQPTRRRNDEAVS